jgi:hypothetical protein
MGPDLHARCRWAGEGEHLKGEHHTLQVELLIAAAAQDHHAVAGVAVPTVESWHHHGTVLKELVNAVQGSQPVSTHLPTRPRGGLVTTATIFAAS